MEADDTKGVANLDPRGIIGRLYVGDTRHCYMSPKSRRFLQFGHHGPDWQDLCSGPLDIATY